MKHKLIELIKEIADSAILNDPETDESVPCAWRNGEVTLPDGTTVPMGGGWIQNEESANQANELAGIAGGLRQGVRYPNETCVGDYAPYGYGEDESGWQELVMPVLLGEDWREHEYGDEIACRVFDAVQDELKSQAE